MEQLFTSGKTREESSGTNDYRSVGEIKKSVLGRISVGIYNHCHAVSIRKTKRKNRKQPTQYGVPLDYYKTATNPFGGKSIYKSEEEDMIQAVQKIDHAIRNMDISGLLNIIKCEKIQPAKI